MTEQEWKDEFAFRLKECMRIKYINNRKLAERTGINEGLISRYRNGDRIPNGINISKLADALDCTPNQLMPHK